jgi:hypothetical protein
MAYPEKFRRKLLAVMEKEELTIEEGAKRFDVGTASVSRWKLNSKPTFTRNRPAQKINMEALKKDVQINPDSYILRTGSTFFSE